MQDLVSIVIPSYKGAAKLERAVASVAGQTYENIEIIVVDDNNPDTEERSATEKIIRELDLPNLKYIKHEENRNGAAARNTGIDAANGRYIGFLDDDDVYLNTRVAESVVALKKDTGCKAVFCNVLHIFGKNRCSIYEMVPDTICVRGILMYEAAIGTGSNLFAEAETVRKLGGFDITFTRHQDLEFAIRLLEQFKAALLDEILVVKLDNGINNEPDYFKMREIKSKYNNKFAQQIAALTIKERQLYYQNCYMRLYQLALNEGIVSEAVKNLKTMERYGYQPGMKQKLQLILTRFGVMKLIRKIQKSCCKTLKSRSAVIAVSELDQELRKQLGALGV